MALKSQQQVFLRPYRWVVGDTRTAGWTAVQETLAGSFHWSWWERCTQQRFQTQSACSWTVDRKRLWDTKSSALTSQFDIHTRAVLGQYVRCTDNVCTSTSRETIFKQQWTTWLINFVFFISRFEISLFQESNTPLWKVKLFKRQRIFHFKLGRQPSSNMYWQIKS